MKAEEPIVGQEGKSSFLSFLLRKACSTHHWHVLNLRRARVRSDRNIPNRRLGDHYFVVLIGHRFVDCDLGGSRGSQGISHNQLEWAILRSIGGLDQSVDLPLDGNTACHFAALISPGRLRGYLFVLEEGNAQPGRKCGPLGGRRCRRNGTAPQLDR